MLQEARDALREFASETDAVILQRFFKTGPGEYGEGDRFLGVRVPATRKVARMFRTMPLADAQTLLTSEIHEERLLPLLILIGHYQRGTADQKQEVFDLYLANTRHINFKEVQRLKTQLDQYTSLDGAQKAKIQAILPEEELRSLRGAYLETAQRLKAQQGKSGEQTSEAQAVIDELDFEFVLFSSALIDYDYIMGLIARYSQEKPDKRTLTRDQLVSLLASSSNLMDERDDIIAYIGTLEAGKGLSEQTIREGYQAFKAQKAQQKIAAMAEKHRLSHEALQTFTDGIQDRMIFDGDQLSDLFAPLELGWKARSKAESALMEDLVPFLKKQAGGREISGLKAYE